MNPMLAASLRVLSGFSGVALSALALAQAPAGQAASEPARAAEPSASSAPSGASAASAPPVLRDLSWLEGCWQGSVNKREFREVWLPQRGAMMVGVSQTVMADKTVDFEYLRLEPRSDGVYYIASPPGKPEEAFRLTDAVAHSDDSRSFVFEDAAREFPQRIAYRRASGGWLYTEVEGKVKGADRKVIYPMRRINCETGEIMSK